MKSVWTSYCRAGMNILEITGTAIGVLYLYWEYCASSWLWLASIAMPAIYLKVYFDAGLYADFGISVYYIVASLYGLTAWLRARKVSSGLPVAEVALPITHTPRRIVIPLILTVLVLMGLLGFFLSRYTDSTVPWADAFTTALSIVALWMLARKYVEQWLVWLVADLAYAFLYAYKGLWLTGGLYLAYATVAVAGYVKWNKSIGK